MTGTNEHIQALEEMLSVYIEERRKKVAAANRLRAQDSRDGMSAAQIVVLQDQIEGLERAIAHEKKLLGPAPASYSTLA